MPDAEMATGQPTRNSTQTRPMRPDEEAETAAEQLDRAGKNAPARSTGQ
jgi:hypothetical protein